MSCSAKVPTPRGGRIRSARIGSSGTIESGNVKTRTSRSVTRYARWCRAAGYAEYCVAPVAQCLPKRARISFAEAAGCQDPTHRVSNVLDRADWRPANRCWFRAARVASRCRDSVAVALGSTVYATAGSDEKCHACVKLERSARLTIEPKISSRCFKKETGGRA